MYRIAHSFALIAFSTFCVSDAIAQPRSDSVPRWEIYAGCAAAYQANWQPRQSDPNRDRDMSTMIREQSELYKNAAIGHYENDVKALPSDARRNVDAYLTANLDRFIAMEKAGIIKPGRPAVSTSSCRS